MSKHNIRSEFTSRTALAMVLVLFMLPQNCFSQGAARVGRESFDGIWWKAASTDEKAGFLYALDDCLTFVRRPALKFDDTWVHYEQKLDRYYADQSSNRKMPVQPVFESLGKNTWLTKDLELVQRYGDEFWRAHNELARRGFVEGYISCRTRESKSPTWSKPLDEYLHMLDDTYDADDRNGEDAPEYTGSVASALEKYSDR